MPKSPKPAKHLKATPDVEARKLPSALARNAAHAAERKRAELREQGEADVALIRFKKSEISDAFYDIGEALVRLKRADVARALGRTGFTEVLKKDLGISATAADRLIGVVTRVRRQDALRWGQEKSAALVELAEATAAPNDTPALLGAAKIRLASGKVLDANASTPREILGAAKEERQARAGKKRGRGRTTTSDERAFAKSIERGLHAAGVPEARVTALATKPGRAADLRIERLPIDRTEALRAVLAKARGKLALG